MYHRVEVEGAFHMFPSHTKWRRRRMRKERARILISISRRRARGRRKGRSAICNKKKREQPRREERREEIRSSLPISSPFLPPSHFSRFFCFGCFCREDGSAGRGQDENWAKKRSFPIFRSSILETQWQVKTSKKLVKILKCQWKYFYLCRLAHANIARTCKKFLAIP